MTTQTTSSLNSTLSTRERRALELLERFRFLTRQQIEQILFATDTTTKPLSRLTITKRILSSLANKNLVQRTNRSIGGSASGSSASAYFLSPAGQQAFGLSGPRRRSPRGDFLAAHALAGAEVFIAFAAAARQHQGHEVAEWLGDHELVLRLGGRVLLPDAYLSYVARRVVTAAFVEIDRGSAGSKFFADKIERYLTFKQDGDWRRVTPEWPKVLTIVTSETRQRLLKRATEDRLARHPETERKSTEFVFAVLHELVKFGPLAEIWMVAGRRGKHNVFTPNLSEDAYA